MLCATTYCGRRLSALIWIGRTRNSLEPTTELGNVVGNLLNRVLKMAGNYRDGVLPAVGTGDSTDANVVETTAHFAAKLNSAYESLELQQCALLPIELARAGQRLHRCDGPVQTRQDPTQAARLDTILNLATQATYQALVGLLPILPEKAAAGLAQLGVDIAGRTIGDLLGKPLPAGHKLG